MTTVTSKIRNQARRRHVVKICRESRAKTGFVVVDPAGMTWIHRTKKGALQHLYAQIRCSKISVWTIKKALLT